MKITIESTSIVVDLETDTGVVPARLWEGTTEHGTPCHAFVTRICPTIDDPPPEITREFERDLSECKQPTTALRAIPLRLIL